MTTAKRKQGRPALFPEGQVQMNIRVPREVYEHLQTVQIIHGMPLAEQLRRALSQWIDANPINKVNGKTKGRK